MAEIDRNSFKSNFEILERNAQKLSDADDVDIDQLVDIVEQSTTAYNACKNRLAAVKTALDKQLSGASTAGAEPSAGTPLGSQGAARRPTSIPTKPTVAGNALDDPGDIPF